MRPTRVDRTSASVSYLGRATVRCDVAEAVNPTNPHPVRVRPPAAGLTTCELHCLQTVGHPPRLLQGKLQCKCAREGQVPCGQGLAACNPIAKYGVNFA